MFHIFYQCMHRQGDVVCQEVNKKKYCIWPDSRLIAISIYTPKIFHRPVLYISMLPYSVSIV